MISWRYIALRGWVQDYLLSLAPGIKHPPWHSVLRNPLVYVNMVVIYLFLNYQFQCEETWSVWLETTFSQSNILLQLNLGCFKALLILVGLRNRNEFDLAAFICLSTQVLQRHPLLFPFCQFLCPFKILDEILFRFPEKLMSKPTLLIILTVLKLKL